jgi:hypothetical protein
MSCDCIREPEEFAWDGTGLKFAVTMTCEGFDMDTDDWTITVVRGGRRVVFTPDSASRETVETEGVESTQWYICVDSSDLGPGELHIIFDAFVPDDDFESGIRHEIQKYKLINIKSL